MTHRPTTIFKIATKSRIVVNALVSIAGQEEGTSLRLSTLAEQEHVSVSYMEQIFARLRRAGIVRGLRGPGGGYVLARPASDITLIETIQVAEDLNDLTNNQDETAWNILAVRLGGTLSIMRLSDLLQHQRAAA